VGKECIWVGISAILPETEIVANQSMYTQFPIDPVNNRLVIGDDGLVYTYLNGIWYGTLMTKPPRAHDPEKDAKVYNKPCEAYKAMWDQSFKKGKVYKETGALITPKGIIVLPMNKNTKTSFDINHFNIKEYPQGSRSFYVQQGDEFVLITGIIHTHPNADPSYQQGPTMYNNGQKDDFSQLEQLGGKYTTIEGTVISTDKVYKYYFDDKGNKIVKIIGSRTDLTKCN